MLVSLVDVPRETFGVALLNQELMNFLTPLNVFRFDGLEWHHASIFRNSASKSMFGYAFLQMFMSVMVGCQSRPSFKIIIFSRQ